MLSHHAALPIRAPTNVVTLNFAIEAHDLIIAKAYDKKYLQHKLLRKIHIFELFNCYIDELK